MNRISVVIPVKEEMSLKFHHEIINSYKNFSNFDITWIVGPNHDGTYADLKSYGQKVIQTTSNSRAERLNIGIKKAQHDIVLLNHPRSFLNQMALEQLSQLELHQKPKWGGFTHEFYKNSHPLLKFTSFYSNFIRFDKKGIIYLDHCIFFTKKLLEGSPKPPFPEEDIFEDTLFSLKLLKKAKPLRLTGTSYTSSVRFDSNGIYKQSYLNQKLKLQNYFGVSSKEMNKAYEKNLHLNSRY